MINFVLKCDPDRHICELQIVHTQLLTARKTLPETEIMLGCARPLGGIKKEIDRLAIDAGLNGIAYPAEGTVAYAREHGLEPQIINACCGVNWN